MVWPVRILRRGFVGASVTWFGALPLATLASSRPHPPTLVYLLSFGTYLVGSLLCHQRPERSFFLWGSQMPVCARCAGIYGGAALAALTLSVAARRTRSTRVALQSGRMLVVASIIPAAATLVYEWTTGATPANWIRAVSGLPIGIVVAWIVLSVLPERPRG
jgi:uncharacterized membrane protein